MTLHGNLLIHIACEARSALASLDLLAVRTIRTAFEVTRFERAMACLDRRALTAVAAKDRLRELGLS